MKADPAKAGEVMQSLAAANNLSAQSLVDASRPDDAPLHGDFEWDDGIAAEEYRKSQARNIIRSIEIVQEDKPLQAPLPVYIKVDKMPEYKPLTLVLEQRDTRQEMLKQAYAELQTFRRKYAMLTELASVYAAIDEAMGESA